MQRAWGQNGGINQNGLIGDDDLGSSDEWDGEDDSDTGVDLAGEQTVEFTSGDTLHGALDNLNLEERRILWRRDDVAAPFPLAIDGIHSLALSKTSPDSHTAPPHATVKLTGGNWLRANVTGIDKDAVRLTLDQGAAISVNRSQIEWIYLTPGAAPECYDGPTSFSGWISAGGWTYRDGALHASNPAPIGRHFAALPEQTEYIMQVNQDSRVGDAFSVVLHARNFNSGPQDPGSVKLMFLGNTLQIVAQIESSMRGKQAELHAERSGFRLYPETELGAEEVPKELQIRVLEDRAAGRIIVFVSGQKVADWQIDKAPEGENGGWLVFQPLGWNSGFDQAISRIQVSPWDGRIPEDDATPEPLPDSDTFTALHETPVIGSVSSIGPDHVTLTTTDGPVDNRLEKPALLRFLRPETPPDEDPPIAHVQLARGGEFDVSRAAFHDGTFVLHAEFAGDVSLPVAALRSLIFSRASLGKPALADEIVFHGGDRLRGKLLSAGDAQKLRWQLRSEGEPVEFDTKRISGVLLASDEKAEPNAAAVVRFRNGDTLAASQLTLDKDGLVVGTQAAGPLTVARDTVRAIYFTPDSRPRIIDGANDSSSFESGPNGPARQEPRNDPNPARPKTLEPWRYFDGAYSVQKGVSRSGSLRFGGKFEAMPDLVEFSFDAVSPNGPAAFSAQLFSGDQNAGYLLQIHSQGLVLYDMAPRRQARPAQMQIQFTGNGKVTQGSQHRHVQLFTDRVSGKMTVFVDNIFIGQFGGKAGSTPRNLGRVITLAPPAGQAFTFSNLWLAPWNGQTPAAAPGLAAANEPTDAAANPANSNPPLDSVLLANGDETAGTVDTIGVESVSLDCDAGPIKLPLPRVTVVEFGGAPPERSHEPRLRFAGLGTLSIKSYKIEDGFVTLQSELAGPLKMPLAALRELIFLPPKSGAMNGETRVTMNEWLGGH